MYVGDAYECDIVLFKCYQKDDSAIIIDSIGHQ